MSNNLPTQPETFSSLFTVPNRRFEIPSYQRAYSWGEKEIKEFLNDLKEASQTYYLGHYLFENKDDDTIYIIDGQQRLTTCVIFFSCIYHALRQRVAHGEEITVDLQRISNLYLEETERKVNKLKTIRDDNGFFTDEVIKRLSTHNLTLDTKSKKRIREAKELFDQFFSDKNTLTKDIERWCNIVENATITHLIVKNKVEATQIFAFQNDRGKRLSNLDIIKSYFMLQILSTSAAVEDDIEYVEREFSTIYTGLVRINTNEDEVVNYYWRAVSGKGYNSPPVVTGVKEILGTHTSDKVTWVRNFISGLAQAFRMVEKIETESYWAAQDLRNLNNMSLSYPLLLKAYAAGAQQSTIERLYRLLENVTFRDLLRGGRADIQSRLNQFLEGSLIGERTDYMINLMVGYLQEQGGWWSYWNDSSMDARLRSGYFYQNRVDNYILWKYELYLSSGGYSGPVRVSYKDLISNESIEHIAPQTPTNNDPCANGYGAYEDKDMPTNGIRSGEWLNCLGNLMLISGSHNSKVSNRAFAIKLASYKADNLLSQQKELEDFVTNKDAPVWDKDAIERRYHKLLSAAKEIWSLNKI